MAGGVEMKVEIKEFAFIKRLVEVLNELLLDERIAQDVRDEYEAKLQEVLDDTNN